VTVVCGVLVPTGSSAMAEPSTPVSLTPYSTPQTTMARAAGLRPSFVPEVEPEEPKALDAATNEWSAADMKSTKIASYLLETAVPFAFLVAPALTQVACTGSAQPTSSAQQPEDSEESARIRKETAYEAMCLQEQARGNKCPTWDEWDR
jgi:hypothetical protein